MVKTEKTPFFRNILVALDGSDDSDQCLRRAVELASLAPGTVVTGIHIFPAPPGFAPKVKPPSTTPFLEFAAKTCKKAKIPFNKRIASGREYRVLDAEIRNGSFDLLIIGASGVGAINKNEIGSVCEMVVKRSKIDILVTKNTAAVKGPILVAVDGSPNSFGAVLTTLELGKYWGLPVTMVSAFDSDYHKAVFNYMGELPTEDGVELFASEEMEKLQQAVTGSGVSKLYDMVLDIGKDVVEPWEMLVDYLPLVGKPAVVIREIAEGKKPSLMVMGKTGIHANGGLTIGSVTENLLHSSGCDLLITSRTHIPVIRHKIKGIKPSAITNVQTAQSGKSRNGPELIATAQAVPSQDGKLPIASETKRTRPLSAKTSAGGLGEAQQPVMSQEADKLLAASSLPDDSAAKLHDFIQKTAGYMGMTSLDSVSGREMLDTFNMGQNSNFESLKWDEKDNVLSFLECLVYEGVGKVEFIMDDKSVYDRPEDIISIFEQNRNNTVQVTIPGNSIIFTTNFARIPDEHTTANGLTVQAPSTKKHIYIRPLLPPSGNFLIRNKGKATIHLVHDRKLFLCQVPFQGLVQAGKHRLIKLGLPHEITQRPNKRKSQRVKVNPSQDLSFEVVIEPSGIVCPATIFDMSADGVSFYTAQSIPQMDSGTKLKFHLEIADKLEVNVTGTVVGKFTKEEKACTLAKLQVERPFAKKMVHDLISFFQYEQKKKRTELFY
jgi:nucleotide-binding universal stress UspA family protein